MTNQASVKFSESSLFEIMACETGFFDTFIFSKKDLKGSKKSGKVISCKKTNQTKLTQQTKIKPKPSQADPKKV